MRKRIEIKPFETYNYLTILKEVDMRYGKRHVMCECKCGNIVEVCYGHLRNGNTKSCGCKKKEKRMFTEEHKKNMSISAKGKIMNKSTNYKNMYHSLKYNTELNWLMSFEDIEKLEFLNRMVAKPNDRLSDDNYILFIEKYYYDKRFDVLYKNWLSNDKETYLRPSFDHIIPRCKGGTNEINNIQILTWFENRCKNDMSQQEWENTKLNIDRYFI